MTARNFLDEKQVHLIFEFSLFLKGAFALLELIGAILAYFIPKKFVLGLVAMLTLRELAEDPRDLVAELPVSVA